MHHEPSSMNSVHSRLSWSRIDLLKEECRDGWNWFHLQKGTPWGDETVRRARLDDQRCNVNMIMYSTSLIRGIVLTWSWIALVVDWHQECVTVWIRWADKLHSSRLPILWKVVLIWLVEWHIPNPCSFPDVVGCHVSLGSGYTVASYLPDLVHVGYQIAVETVVSSSELLRGAAGAVSSAARDIARLTFSFGLVWVPLL